MYITKYQFLSLRRDAIVQRQLCNCHSLRTVAVSCQYIDKILKQLNSKNGWTDMNGETHFGDQLYQDDVDIAHIPSDDFEGTPAAYH